MCGGVLYTFAGQEIRVFFPNARAGLPVLTRDGEVVRLPWGRRQGQVGRLPLGGWARLDAIHAGQWDRWFPVPVKMPLTAFMERDIEDRSHWYALTKGQWVQGLVARDKYERRVYVVTVTPEAADAMHARWPRIMSG
jgi:hypothetical protein